MLKNILNLNGVQKLSEAEQKAISGGRPEHCSTTVSFLASSLAECKEGACLFLRYNPSTLVCTIIQHEGLSS